MTMKSHLVKAAIASVLALGSVSVFAAGSDTSDLDISAKVVSNCLISTSPVNFGDYDPINVNSSTGADIPQSGTIHTTCTYGSTPSITLGGGDNHAATRQMTDGSGHFLSYELYTNAGLNTVWAGLVSVNAPTPDGTQKDTTVYGNLPKGQNVPVGDYADTVVATVNF